MSDWVFPPYTCDMFDPEPVGIWRIYADDGVTVLNRLLATKCNAEYACRVFEGLQFYPPNVAITCEREEPIPEPEDPPVDPEPTIP